MSTIPKLDTKTARAVNKAEGGSVLVAPGVYLATLREVIVSPKPDRNKNHYWIWTFELDESEHKGSKIKTNTGLAENQHWYMKMVFDAFGAKPNVSTDTLLGKQVKLVIDQSEITAGARKGQLRSEITSLMSPEADEDGEDEFDEDGEEDDGEEDGEPDF